MNEKERFQFEQLAAFAREFLRRVPECTCAEYYKPHFPRTDPQCPFHGYFEFDENEIANLKRFMITIE